jgi:hypothetical protein
MGGSWSPRPGRFPRMSRRPDRSRTSGGVAFDRRSTARCASQARSWSDIDLYISSEFRIDVSSEAGSRFDQNVAGAARRSIRVPDRRVVVGRLEVRPERDRVQGRGRVRVQRDAVRRDRQVREDPRPLGRDQVRVLGRATVLLAWPGRRREQCPGAPARTPGGRSAGNSRLCEQTRQWVAAA